MMATNSWNLRIVEYLTERMVNPTVKDAYGFTAKEKAKIKNLNTIYEILKHHEEQFKDQSNHQKHQNKLKEERKWLK